MWQILNDFHVPVGAQIYLRFVVGVFFTVWLAFRRTAASFPESVAHSDRCFTTDHHSFGEGGIRGAPFTPKEKGQCCTKRLRQRIAGHYFYPTIFAGGCQEDKKGRKTISFSITY